MPHNVRLKEGNLLRLFLLRRYIGTFDFLLVLVFRGVLVQVAFARTRREYPALFRFARLFPSPLQCEISQSSCDSG